MNRTRRTSLLGLLGVAAAAAASLPLIAVAGPSGPQAPDLRADPVENVEGPGVYFNTEGGLGNGSLLIRFDGFVTNVGQGPLEVRGNPQVPGDVRQFARPAPGQPANVAVGTPEVRYEAEDSHNHWHLMRVMRYSLWNLQKTGQVAPGQKVGFCLYDLQQATGAPVTTPSAVYTEGVTRFCESADLGDGPEATSLRMGVSAGWRDVYDKALAYQWIDVSDTSPGTYLVGAEADPDGIVWEGGGAAEVNAPAFATPQVTVPGWVAQPVALDQSGAAQVVPVSAARFGGVPDSTLRYRVATDPSHGSLNVPAGGVFLPGQPLVYTPAPGYTGPDSFTYLAFSGSSPFPRNPPAAAVSVAGQGPSITLSGAPASMVAGTSAQLGATLANAPAGVAWSATTGTVSPTGLFTAPSTPPAGGAVTVRVQSATVPGLAAEAVIGIRRAPATTAKPDVRGRLTAGRTLLSPVRVTPFGRRIIVSKVVTGRSAGRVVVTATVGKRVVGRCVAKRIGARKAFTCKITMARPYPLKKVRVTARFTAAKGGATAVRRAFAAR